MSGAVADVRYAGNLLQKSFLRSEEYHVIWWQRIALGGAISPVKDM